jgi:hypothetical protein
MIPTPGNLITAVRSILKEEIAPEIGSPEAIPQLRRIMAVLRDYRWEEAGFDLMAENDVLAQMLVTSGATPSDGLTSRPASFAAANAENLRLRTDLSARIQTLTVGSQPDASTLRLALIRSFQSLRPRS